MSRSVDLFIDSQLPLPDVAHALAVLTGASSTPSGSGGFRLQRGAMVADVRSHGYVDDGALRFSRYPYVLSARFATDASPAASPEVAFVRYAADLVRDRMDSTALLVLDLEQRDRAGVAARSDPDDDFEPDAGAPDDPGAGGVDAGAADVDGMVR